MARLSFWDCNVTLGERPKPGRITMVSVPPLLDEMDRFGIGKALVCSTEAFLWAPARGNEKTLKLRDESAGRLMPCFVAAPHFTGESPAPDEFMEQMRREDVRAIRLFPTTLGFSTAEWSCGPLFEACEVNRVPILAELGEMGGWNAMAHILEHHESLPFVVLNLNYRCARQLYPMLARFPNLKIEISGYQVHAGIEDIADTFGGDRMLFGSNLPIFQAGTAVGTVTYARLSENDRYAIARCNLQHLLERAFS